MFKSKFNKMYRNVIAEMNDEIMNKVGFGKEVEAKNNGLCPFCKTAVKPDSFRDEVSAREYKISGLCQACQDKVFGTETAETDDAVAMNDTDYHMSEDEMPDDLKSYLHAEEPEDYRDDDYVADRQDFQDEDFEDFQDEDEEFQDEDFEDFQDEDTDKDATEKTDNTKEAYELTKDLQDEDFEDFEDFQDEDEEFQDEDFEDFQDEDEEFQDEDADKDATEKADNTKEAYELTKDLQDEEFYDDDDDVMDTDEEFNQALAMESKKVSNKAKKTKKSSKK